LEIHLQRGVERELKGLVLLFTHWVQASGVSLRRQSRMNTGVGPIIQPLTQSSKRKCGLKPVGDDVEFFVVYERPAGGYEHLPATFQPGIVDSASRGHRPIGVFGLDNKGNLLDQQCFYPARNGDDATMTAEVAKQRLDHLYGKSFLDDIEDLN
jgi:hypothetical protein